jgi:hypothetical protein
MMNGPNAYPDGPVMLFYHQRGTWWSWCGSVRSCREHQTIRVRAERSEISCGWSSHIQCHSLSSRDVGGGIFPRYEFISISYNGWVCESPFVAYVFGIYILLLVSYDRKLGATNFSNVNANFLIVSSNPPIYYFI